MRFSSPPFSPKTRALLIPLVLKSNPLPFLLVMATAALMEDMRQTYTEVSAKHLTSLAA